MGTGDLSDGVYVWPEGLWIYVERFGIRLPDDMVQHMRSRGFDAPRDLDVAALGECPVDVEYWGEWAARNANRGLR